MDEKALRRELGLWLGVLVVINATIGTGIFKKPAQVAQLTGSLSAYLLVWIAGGVIALMGALSLAELAAALPRTGGIYEYLRRAYGRTVAFLFGWTTLVLLTPSAVGSFGRLGAESLMSIAGVAPDRTIETIVAMAIVIACAVANLAGVRQSATGQALVAGAKYAGVALVAVLGLLVAPAASPVPLPAKIPAFETVPTLAGCFAALVAVMWAYDGWGDLARIAGEVRDPARNLPRGLVLGTLAILAVYGVANLGYMRALGIEGMRLSTTGEHMAAAHVVTAAIGDAGRRVFSAIVLVSCIGCCMTTLLTMPRVFVAMSTDGLFPRALGAVTARGVPARSVLICAIAGAGYVAVRSFEQLTDAFVVGSFPFYMLAVVAVEVLRRREPDLPRPFRVPGYPVVPLLFLAGSAALLYGGLTSADSTALVAFAIMFAGLPVALIWLRLLRLRD